MAWKLWSSVCCGQKWRLLLCPLLLLFLVLCVMKAMLRLPLASFEPDQRLSRSLSSTGLLRSRSRGAGLLPGAASLPPPAHAHRSASQQPIIPGNRRKKEGARRSGVRGGKHRRKTAAGAERLLGLPGNRIGPKRRFKPVELSGNVHAERKSPDPQLQVNTAPDGPTNGRTHPRKRKTLAEQLPLSVGNQQLVLEKPPGDPKKPPSPSEASEHGVLERRKPLSQPTGPRWGWDDGEVCSSAREHHFSDSDRRPVRVPPGAGSLPWLSQDDLQKMALLAGGEVLSKAKLPAHGQVLQVALAPNQRSEQEPHLRRCQRGLCSLVKRTDDWFEVFAFHLDRVLGLNRSLPAVLRTFRSQILPYRYISGVPRPVVWWDPDIQHLASRDNDQNSVPLSWVQYQKLLQVRCGMDAGLWAAPCVGIHHSEWGRLALFDFLLQVNDRLDRYCCGFWPEPTEACVENRLRTKCGNAKDLLLVHILVRKADPSRLVFIDNSGRPHQSIDNLNFQLVEGISEFPERAVSVLQSGCLESLLLHSLYTDREFWESQGGADGLRPLIRAVELRGKLLLQHIRDKKLQLKRDL